MTYIVSQKSCIQYSLCYKILHLGFRFLEHINCKHALVMYWKTLGSGEYNQVFINEDRTPIFKEEKSALSEDDSEEPLDPESFGNSERCKLWRNTKKVKMQETQRL